MTYSACMWNRHSWPWEQMLGRSQMHYEACYLCFKHLCKLRYSLSYLCKLVFIQYFLRINKNFGVWFCCGLPCVFMAITAHVGRFPVSLLWKETCGLIKHSPGTFAMFLFTSMEMSGLFFPILFTEVLRRFRQMFFMSSVSLSFSPLCQTSWIKPHIYCISLFLRKKKNHLSKNSTKCCKRIFNHSTKC